jgi:hypothetical protein
LPSSGLTASPMSHLPLGPSSHSDVTYALLRRAAPHRALFGIARFCRCENVAFHTSLLGQPATGCSALSVPTKISMPAIKGRRAARKGPEVVERTDVLLGLTTAAGRAGHAVTWPPIPRGRLAHLRIPAPP